MSIILTVEDEFLVSEYLSGILNDEGYTVISVKSANEAIAVLESRNDIKLIITDVSMPGTMDGLKLAAAVRGRWPPIKIIITTGLRLPTKHEMPTGSLLLQKPYSPVSVVEAVARLL